MASPTPSVRNTMAGSGTVLHYGFTTRPSKLVFSAAPAVNTLIPGVTIRIANSSPLYFTLDRQGKDNLTWYTVQSYASNVGALGFRQTDTSTARGRGSGTSAELVPNAVYYQYCSYIDDGGKYDWYLYIDTVPPLGGCHPFTKDQSTGKSWSTKITAANAIGVLVPNLAERVAALDSDPPVIY